MGRKLCIVTAGLIALAAAGCSMDAMRYFFYAITPESDKTVEPKFAGLPGHSVAVVVYTTESVDFDYPYARLRVGKQVSAKLAAKVKDLKAVDTLSVIRYQDENLHWDALPKTDLGKALKADYVLLISLVEYTSQEPNSVGLCRGRIVAEASLYQTSLPENESRVWDAPNLTTVFPKDAQPGMLRDQADRLLEQAEGMFAESLAKEFYKHKVEEKP